jgi:hypothetical protein
MLTSTPEIIFVFVMFFAPQGGGKPQREELYVSTDKAACEAQATDWSAKMAPLRFICVQHNQKKLKVPEFRTGAEDE